MKTGKKILGLLLAAMMLFSCMAVMASADVVPQALKDNVDITLNYQAATGMTVTGNSTATVHFPAIETDTKYPALPAPKADGYTFVGWNMTSDNTGTKAKWIKEGDVVAATAADIPPVLYAVWAKNEYRLYFDAAPSPSLTVRPPDLKHLLYFGFPDSNSTSIGTAVVPPAAPAGKTLAGWVLNGTLIPNTAGKYTYSVEEVMKIAGLSPATEMVLAPDTDKDPLIIAGVKFSRNMYVFTPKWYDVNPLLKSASYAVQYKYGSTRIDLKDLATKDFGPIVWTPKTEADAGIISITGTDYTITPLKTTGMKKATVHYIGTVLADDTVIEITVDVTVSWWQYLIIIPLLGFLWY